MSRSLPNARNTLSRETVLSTRLNTIQTLLNASVRRRTSYPYQNSEKRQHPC